VNQTRLGSLIEAGVNIVIGYGINFAMNLVILNGVFGLGVTLTQNIGIGLLFTVVSMVRQYILRRWFNARLQRAAQRMAAKVAG
jgi:hypothetical protein